MENNFQPDIKNCPINHTLDLIGGKWKLTIIYRLLDGTKRFKELERSIEGINTRMLVKELKSLEQNGIIHREVYPEIPPRVEYSLTAQGRSLENILLEMKKWGKSHMKQEHKS